MSMEHGARHIGDSQKKIVKLQHSYNMYFICFYMDWVKFSAHVNCNLRQSIQYE